MTIHSEQTNSWFEAIRQTLGFDRRSMAVFRICLGLMLLVDLLLRSQTLTAMYTDDGYFTRDLAEIMNKDIEFNYGVEHTTYWSLYHISGSYEFQVFLFWVAAVFAAMLILGAWTRVATIASWVLLASLQDRNPLILTSGDSLLKMMLFWSMFIPLGSIWSVDAWRRKKAPPAKSYVASVATFGMIVQLFCMYFFAGLAKWNEIWHTGDAMQYVLRLNIYATSFGQSLLEYPTMLKLVTWATLWGELILPWFMFLPGLVVRIYGRSLLNISGTTLRMFLIVAFWILHISIAMSMEIGLFCYISMLAWLPMIPGKFWNWVRVPLPTRLTETLTNEGPSTEAQPNSNWQVFGKYAVALVCAFFVYLVVAWNIINCHHKNAAYALPKPLRWFGMTVKIRQHFKMFDVPPNRNPWYVYHARLRNGDQVDVMRGGKPVDYKRPDSVKKTMPLLHWRKLHRNLVGRRAPLFKQRLAEYAAKDWNRNHDEEHQVIQLQLICYLDHIGPNYNAINYSSYTWGVFTTKEAAGSNFDAFLKQMGMDKKNF